MPSVVVLFPFSSLSGPFPGSCQPTVLGPTTPSGYRIVLPQASQALRSHPLALTVRISDAAGKPVDEVLVHFRVPDAWPRAGGSTDSSNAPGASDHDIPSPGTWTTDGADYRRGSHGGHSHYCRGGYAALLKLMHATPSTKRLWLPHHHFCFSCRRCCSSWCFLLCLLASPVLSV